MRIPKESTIEVAKANKVLYQLGQLFTEVQKSSEWLEVSKRCVAQVEELIGFNEVANETGLQYVVVKTFRFPRYVPDDIDVLIHPDSSHLIQEFISKLFDRHGYFLRSKGTTEATIRKLVNGTYVDFDIHSDLGAGQYTYLDSKVVFQNSRNIEVGDANIPIVDKELELIICAAHAVMKEFELTLADILTFLHIFSSIETGKILKIAENLGLKNAVHAFYRFSQLITENILKGKAVVLPYRIPMHFTAFAYIENAEYRLKFNGIKPVKDLLTFPSARGIKKLIGLK